MAFFNILLQLNEILVHVSNVCPTWQEIQRQMIAENWFPWAATLLGIAIMDWLLFNSKLSCRSFPTGWTKFLLTSRASWSMHGEVVYYWCFHLTKGTSNLRRKMFQWRSQSIPLRRTTGSELERCWWVHKEKWMVEASWEEKRRWQGVSLGVKVRVLMEWISHGQAKIMAAGCKE